MEDQWKNANEDLNQLIELGKGREGFEKYYAEDVVMQENETEPRIGKNTSRELCFGEETAKKHADLKLTIISTAYGDHLSIQEVMFDYTGDSGEHIHYPEVAVRHWQDGLVIREKFYYAS